MTMADTAVASPMKVDLNSRKNKKPLMEKRRRARINSCLSQLKSLVLQAIKKDSSQFSKLEKADILELTVKHLRALQRQQAAGIMTSDPSVVSKYRAGFNECAKEVIRYMSSVRDVSDEIKERVVCHLASCLQVVNHMAPPHSEPLPAPHPHCLKPLHVHIPPQQQSQALNAAMPAPALLVPQGVGVLPASALSLTPSSLASTASSSPGLPSSPVSQPVSPVTAVSIPSAIQTVSSVVTSHSSHPAHVSGAFKIVPTASCPAGAVALYLGSSTSTRAGDVSVDAVPVYSVPLPQADGGVTAFVPPSVTSHHLPQHVTLSSVKQEYLSCAVDLRQHSKLGKPVFVDTDRTVLPVGLGQCAQASLSDEKLWRPW